MISWILIYKICFFVPESHLEVVKQSLFNAGAGKLGNYSCCSWQVLGEGQFKPIENSTPFIGETNKISTVKEYKVEVLCMKTKLNEAIEALLDAHPYEVPAFEVIEVKVPKMFVTTTQDVPST
jgi:hypothetical protein